MKAKGIAILLAGLMLFVFACNDPAKNEEEAKFGVSVLPATEKILQNIEYDLSGYGNKIEITTVKGEYESVQIILSAETAISSYDILTETLHSDKGEYSAENIFVYNEKYINVSRNFENNGAPTGMYPDALLPFEIAKEYGENKIKAGENQGIYLTFYIPYTQEEGIYTGNITLSVGGKSIEIGVALTVLSLEMSEICHTKNVFLTTWGFENGELNSSQEMMDAYTDKLIEYRLAPDVIVKDTSHSADDIEYYTDKAFEYMQNKRCSNISIPYSELHSGTQVTFDQNITRAYFESYARKSIEEHYNMFEKSVVYFHMIDEPDDNGIHDRCKQVLQTYRALVDSIAADVLTWETGDKEFLAELAQSIADVPCLVTSKYNQDFADTGAATFCPTVNQYDTEENRALYADQNEQYWYTCISPRVPYPTLHLEDTLVSARLMPWMQAEYNVVGNLYWATNLYAAFDNMTGTYQGLDDYFSNPERTPRVNGDGFLFYPGGQYGMTEPIVSMRLEALRDGFEEYELLYALKEKYAEISAEAECDFDAISAIESLRGLLYTGTRVSGNSALLQQARTSVLDLLEMANSAAGVCITDYTDNGYGEVTYKVFVKDGYELVAMGETLLGGTTFKGGKMYEFAVDRAEGESIVSFEVKGTDLSFAHYIGGSVENISAEEFTASFEEEGVSVSTECVLAETIDGNLSGKINKITVSASDDALQSFRLDGAVLPPINADSEKLTLRVFSDEEGTQFVVSAKFMSRNLYYDLSSVTLRRGLNTIEISLGSLSTETLGGLDYLIFYLGTTRYEPQRTIWFYDISVYNTR